MSDWKQRALEAREIYEQFRDVSPVQWQQSAFIQHLWEFGIQPEGFSGRLPHSFGDITAYIENYAFDWWSGDSGNVADGSVHMWVKCPDCSRYLPLGRVCSSSDIGDKIRHGQEYIVWHTNYVKG